MKKYSWIAIVLLAASAAFAVNPNPPPANPPLVITSTPPVTVQAQLAELNRSVSNLEKQVAGFSTATSGVLETAARIGADSSLSGHVASLIGADSALSGHVARLVGSDSAISGEVDSVRNEIYAPTNSIVPANAEADLGSEANPWRHGYFTAHSLHIGDTVLSEGSPGSVQAEYSYTVVTNAINLVRDPTFEDPSAWYARPGQSIAFFTNNTAVNTNDVSGSVVMRQNYEIAQGAYTLVCTFVDDSAGVIFGVEYPAGNDNSVVTYSMGSGTGCRTNTFTCPVTGATNFFIQINSHAAISDISLTREGYTIVVTNQVVEETHYVTEELDPAWGAAKSNYFPLSSLVEAEFPTNWVFEYDPITGAMTNAVVESGAFLVLP